MRLSGKVAIVTGAGRGIGKAIAERFAQEGAKVVIAEVEPGYGEGVERDLNRRGFHTKHMVVDVSEPEKTRWLVSETLALFGGLDILVNNAALPSSPYAGNLSELPLDSFRTMMRANLESVMLMSQAAATAMIARGSGAIINISSVMYLLGVPGRSAYQVAKGAVVTLTRSLAVDLAKHNIVVNAIAPGWIDTRHNVEVMATAHWQNLFLKSGRIPLHRPGQPEEIASLALSMASPDFSYVTGQTLIADGGMCLTLGE